MITLTDLRFAWHKLPVINIKQLEIHQGKHLFIAGPSGSGKSTLLNLLAGIITPQHGDISILGQALNTFSQSRKDTFRADHIGFIFQQFNLIPYLSVLDNITLPCSFSTVRRQKVLASGSTLADEALRLLAALGLNDPDVLARNVNELSVGQQQRVAAARAMLGSPEIIIADEPTSALDNAHRQAFIDLLFEECNKAAITLIFVSHDISLKPLFDHCIDLQQINNTSLKGAI